MAVPEQRALPQYLPVALLIAGNQRRLAAAIEEAEASGVERPLLEKARKAVHALRKKKSQGKPACCQAVWFRGSLLRTAFMETAVMARRWCQLLVMDL